MDTNERNKNGIRTIKYIIISILIIAVILLIGVAYARYVTSLNGNTQVAIAKWNFNVTAGSSQSLDIDLADTRLANDTTEVARNKVAPGTAGALQLNVNATGTQVSLEYDIDLSLTQIPENLIFYSDSNMTNAIYKENGTIHLEGYFGANENNKTETKTLYWQWAMETGSTKAEIDANDLLDSEWMGDRIILGIQATGRQVMEENSTEGQYAVTFDADGGTLQGYGNASQTTKMVTYGENYGTLPIPTREGYTFAGWHGKNIYDFGKSEDYYVYRDNMSIDVNQKSITVTKADSWAGDYWRNEKNKFGYGTYTVSAVFSGDTSPRHIIYTFDENNNIIDNTNLSISGLQWNNHYHGWLSNSQTQTVTIPSSVSYWKYGSSFSGLANTVGTISNIQIEKSSTATTYEPYYITSSTEVVQNQNHTLTAIWEPISN